MCDGDNDNDGNLVMITKEKCFWMVCLVLIVEFCVNEGNFYALAVKRMKGWKLKWKEQPFAFRIALALFLLH